MRKINWISLVQLVTISLAASIAIYFLNYSLFPILFPKSALSRHDMLFLEGLMFVIVGVLIFLGYGGLNIFTYRATVLSSAASAISGKETVGPKEILEHNKWRAKGHLRLAIILALTGVILLTLYFVTV